MIAFLSPMFLAGLATAAIPVIIHLIHRRRAHVVPFSSLMFLRISNHRIARRQRLRELLMLALRCALLAMLAVAFAGPFLAWGPGAGKHPVHAAFVMDDSFSMGYRHGRATSFDLARDAATALIDSLPKDSEAALFFAGANRDRELTELTPGVIELKSGALSASLSATAAPVGPAVARAAEVLAKSPWPKREIYVFTDLQKRAWDGFEAPDLMAGGLAVIVVDCGADAAPNLAITDVKPARSSRGSAVELKVLVETRNFGQDPRQAPVELRLGETDAQLRATETLDVPGRGVSRNTIAYVVQDAAAPGPFQSSGIAGRVELAADALPVDDARYFVLSGSGGPRVLLVGEDKGGAKDLFYIESALHLGPSPFETFRVAPGELSSMRLDDYDVVVAGQMPGLTPEAARALAQFAAAGRGLLLFLGPDVPIARYNDLLAQPTPDGAAILPAKLGAVVQKADQERVAWDEVDLTHPVFQVFAGSLAQDLGFVLTGGYVALESGAGAATRILARYADGAPAVVEGSPGPGRVILFTTSCDGAWSNLPLRASFVPILHRSITYLAQRLGSSDEVHFVGQPLEFVFPAHAGPVSVEVTTPDGQEHVAISQVSGRQNRAVFPNTDLPGLYRFSTNPPQTGGARTIAVNVDVSESELTRLTPAQLKSLLPNLRIDTPGTSSESAIGSLQLGSGVKLTGGIIMFLVALALAESVLAALFTPRRRPDGVRARSLDLAGPGDNADAGSEGRP